MLSSHDLSLPHGPLYDPKRVVVKYRYTEDFEKIRLNLLGTDTLFVDPHFHYKLETYMEWRRPKEICDHPYFIKDKPSRSDALQGNLGDSWLMAGIIALTSHEKLIAHVVPSDQSFDHDYVGAFHFRIWQLGTWYDVVVDDRLPVFKQNKKLGYGHSVNGDVFWAPLLEKAYAKICGYTYDVVINGNPITAFQDFSGGIVQTLSLNVFNQTTTDLTMDWFINRVLMDDAFICCSCIKNLELKKDRLISNHIYTIINVYKCADDDPDYPGLFLINIMNPLGAYEWKGPWSDYSPQWEKIDQKIRQKLVLPRNDGEFWMEKNDFIKYFQTLYVCYLGPGQYREGRSGVHVGTNWRTTTFKGEWRVPVTVGGSSRSSRHQNPQYRIVLDRRDNDPDRDGLCLVVFELTQRSRNDYTLMRVIGFYIYSLTNVRYPPLPLNFDFFQKHEALNEDVMFFSSERSIVITMNLKPGKYCLVPCTYQRNEDQQFLFRIFSESRVEMWEYDTQIAKSLPEEEENLTGPDDELQALFYDASDCQDEINWIGLQEILHKALNPNKSYSSVIGTFFKFIWDVMETFHPLPPSDDCVTSEIVFSKDDCRSMIAMLDENYSGKLSFSEFSSLWNKILFWCRVYRENCEGCMPVSQLRDALSSIGYNVNIRIIHTMIHLYANEHDTITLEDFVLCGVVLETTLSHYQNNDTDSGNKIIFNLEEWVKQTLFL